MPRRRMIDPQYWSDELIGGFKRDVRLFYIGLWNFADDEGRFRANFSLLKGQIFPYDPDIKQKHIEKFLKVLETAKRIVLYSVDNQSFGCVCNFKKHQTINRPTPSVLPAPPKIKLTEDSLRTHGGLTEDSRLREVKLSKEKLREVNKESTASPDSLSTSYPQSKENLWQKIKERTGWDDKQIGVLCGTKTRKKNVYGFGHPSVGGLEALLEFLNTGVPDGVEDLFLYAKRVASDPMSAEKYKKQAREKWRIEQTRIGNLLPKIPGRPKEPQ